MTQRDQILKEVMALSHYKKLCKGIARADLADDLYQEFLLALLTYPYLEQVYEKEWFNYFCIRIITNLYNSETSTFYIKYRQGDDVVVYRAEIKTPIEDKSADTEDDVLEVIVSELSKIDWRDRELFKAYAKTCSSKALSRRIKMSQKKILEAVARVKTHIINSKSFKEALKK